jgi:hypothetical protein
MKGNPPAPSSLECKVDGKIARSSRSPERYEVTVRIRDQGPGALNGRPLTLSGGIFENGGLKRQIFYRFD